MKALRFFEKSGNNKPNDRAEHRRISDLQLNRCGNPKSRKIQKPREEDWGRSDL
jgi:hypothetical protein